VQSRAPIPLVRIEAGLEVAGEQFLVAFEGAPGQGGVDQVLDDDEPVAGEGVDLLARQCK
jgi:hypothetical protein